ncbi:MAG: uroporphyrinogen decarboxylase family protein, partial [Oscillospiraceae bacterium]|nr:uroporphyrinogen decarboxylase family protein [Oscillospiraceae bacterium]
EPIYQKIRDAKGPNYKYCFDSSILMLAHNMMNKKQFERFYWPYLKKLLDVYAENKMNIRIFTEGSILRLAEYFKDYPKGLLTFHLEQDDPFEFREALPNVAIMGGMTTDLLSNGTPEECVAYAKRLCDELGKDGGFIFSENKMISYRNDAKAENMLAVNEFVRDYRIS